MSTVQLGRQLTACQDALDKAGRLLALQAKVTAYGGPSADVEQQLHTALDQVTRTALVAADAAAAYVAGHAEQQRLDGV
jgi:hypothetical protein